MLEFEAVVWPSYNRDINHFAYFERNDSDACYLVDVNVVQLCYDFGIANDYKVVERCKIYDAHYAPNRSLVNSFELVK